PLQAAVLLPLVRSGNGLFGGLFNVKPQDAPQLIELGLEEVERLEGGSVFEEPAGFPAGRGSKLAVHLRLDHSQLPGDRLNSLEHCALAWLGLPHSKKSTSLGAGSFHDLSSGSLRDSGVQT